MADKIEEFSVNNLTYSMLIDYTGSVIDAIRTEPPVEIESIHKLEDARNAFKESLGKTSARSKLSLKAIDRKNDQLWRQARAIAKIAAKNPDDEDRIHGERALEIFVKMPDPTRSKYTMAYGLLERQLDELEALGPDTLKRAFLASWVKALRQGFNEFRDARQQKLHERAEAEQGINAKLRDELCNAYLSVVERLNAIAVLMPDEAHSMMIARINRLIADQRLSAKLGKRKKDPDSLDDVTPKQKDADEEIINASDAEIDGDPEFGDPELKL